MSIEFSSRFTFLGAEAKLWGLATIVCRADIKESGLSPHVSV